MELVDRAINAYRSLLSELQKPEYWESIKTEADTRMKIIDRVFVDVLGWPHGNIHLENDAGPRFIDYRCTVDGLNRLIVEAKREGRDLGINAEHAGRFFRLNGAVFSRDAAQEGIMQAISYCACTGAELACITNGRQWAVFRGAARPDGAGVLQTEACVFGSPLAVEKQFTKFYDLLSFDAVSAFNYRAVFNEASAQPMRSALGTVVVRKAETRSLLPADKLSNDLERIMQSFFRDLGDEDDGEARRACFVVTDESTLAEHGLARISEDLRNKVRSLSENRSDYLTEVVKRVREMKRHELVLLVGTKGAGKSTFIERFFEDVLPREIRRDCIIVRVDLSKSGSATNVIDWLNKNVLSALESSAYPSGGPEYDELQGMFYDEYRDWKRGHAKHQYESNKTQFKIDFGNHIEHKRRSAPHEYIVKMLLRLASNHKKVPCLIFDNADHFNVDFQQTVFNYAHSIYQQALCLVLIPITDTTSWQLSKHGPMQSFFTDSYYLPTPPTELIVRRRIEYIEQKIAEEQSTNKARPVGGRGYFFARGIPLEIEDIAGFAACLQTVFLNTGHVARWIGRLANHDIRRSLQLTREVVASPYIRVADLLAAHVSKTSMPVDVVDVMLAIVRGKYDIYYPAVQAFVQNVFHLYPEQTRTTPLLVLRILQILDAAREENPDNDQRYVLVCDVVNYCEAMNVEPTATTACLNAMLEKGLCLGYDPTRDKIGDVERVEVSPSGQQHLAWGLSEWVYIESMCEVTPMFDREAVDRMRGNLEEGAPHSRRQAMDVFLRYVLSEDEHYCVTPKHPSYQGQHELRKQITQQLAALSKVESYSGNARYCREIGRVVAWKQEKGYGFIRPNAGGADVFIHIKDVLDINDESLPEGTLVEYESVQRQNRYAAKTAIVLRP